MQRQRERKIDRERQTEWYKMVSKNNYKEMN